MSTIKTEVKKLVSICNKLNNQSISNNEAIEEGKGKKNSLSNTVALIGLISSIQFSKEAVAEFRADYLTKDKPLNAMSPKFSEGVRVANYIKVNSFDNSDYKLDVEAQGVKSSLSVETVNSFDIDSLPSLSVNAFLPTIKEAEKGQVIANRIKKEANKLFVEAQTATRLEYMDMHGAEAMEAIYKPLLRKAESTILTNEGRKGIDTQVKKVITILSELPSIGDMQPVLEYILRNTPKEALAQVEADIVAQAQVA